MKKNLLKTVLFISMVIGISYMSCKPGDFTEEDAMLLQSKLEKQMLITQDSLAKVAALRADLRADSLRTASAKITYTLCLVDASKATLLKSGDTGTDAGIKGGLTGGSVTMTQAGVAVTKTSASTGLVVFDNLRPGIATLHVVLTGYSEVNAMVDFVMTGYAPTANGGIEAGNVLPLIPLSGTSTGTLKGTVTCETDLTNKAPEVVPTGTKVIATVDPSSSILDNIKNESILFNISYDGLSLEAATDATGAYTMTVPGTTMGLDYLIKVSDFSANQSLLMNTKAYLPVTGVQTVPTSFGSTFTSASTVPSVNAVFVTIGAPDYTYTQATATAVIYNPNGLDYFVPTSAGNYYYPSFTFSGVTIDSPAPGTGGTKAVMGFTVNSNGQVTSTTVSSKGSSYATTVQGTTFTLPYIRTAAKMTVDAVDANGKITTYHVSTAGQFFSTSNLEFVSTSGAGAGAVFPSISSYALNYGASGISFTLNQSFSPSPVLGTSGYVVGDVFTLQVKSGSSDPMTGKIFMTTGSVTAINITNEGANYIPGRVGVLIANPGLSGTAATVNPSLVVVKDGKITSIPVATGGSNYSTAPAVTILNGVEKVQALATANVSANGNITSITVTNAGDGYLAIPTVTLTPQVTGVGSGASAVAVLTSGTVSSVQLINGGSGYIGINTPASAVNAPSSVSATVKGTGTTIANYYLGTGLRSIVQ